MPSVEDWANYPLGIIQNIFDKNGSYDSSLVQDFFSKKLSSKTALTWIPSLNDTPLHELRPSSLVRFRCMVQDMFDPEYYLGAYEVKYNKTAETFLKSGKYKDVAECAVNTGTSLGPDLNFPLPGETGPPCLVKVYDDMNGYKVNDVVEFVGVLSVDPTIAQFPSSETSEESAMVNGPEVPQEELDAHAPPPSLVPRLHCVVAHKLSHVNPLLSQKDSEEFKTDLEHLQAQADAIRSQLLSVLTHAMLGDGLAAEFFLCHLVSTVYGRADVMPLGKFCLNVSNSPRSSTYSSLLHFLMTNLLTQTHLLPMSLENMNTLPFSPKKDYTSNRLRSGILQLADQTALVIDETALQPGQLDPNGVRNIQALGNLISWQKVEYDFSFHKQDFVSNVSVLVLSEGKSILPSDSQVPMSPGSVPDNMREYFTRLDPLLTPDCLSKVRTYLSLAKLLQYDLNDDLQKVMQEDFVDARKEDPKNMTIEDFHGLLSLVRLLSVSCLKSCPTLELWRRAKNMERQRKQRLSQQPARPRTGQ